MDLKFVVLLLFLVIHLNPSKLAANELRTINISMPSNYGTFFGEIHYDQKDLAIALRIERVIKEDLPKVINYFEYVPYDVVHFNIDPYMRLTNGNARPFPTNIINLYNFPASNMDHLISMENWLQGLVFHEFIHITHLDQTRGYLNIGRNLFGTVAKIPASVVPSWFTEGIAVWGESHLINGGRLNNKLFNKELLIQFKNPNFCKTIDCLDTPGVFPNGQLAYWAGSHFMEYLENLKPKTLKCLVEYNSSSIPFFLNDAFLFCAGASAQDLFNKFRENYIEVEGDSFANNDNSFDKITNIFGSTDFQKGLVLDGERLFKIEKNKHSEALVAYDLKDGVSYQGKFNLPVADIASVMDSPQDGKLLLMAFNDDPNSRIQNKAWKLINADTLLIERDLNFAHDPSYVIPLGNDHFLTFSYWENKWIVENKNEILRSFPDHYNISFVKKIGDSLLLKMNDANGVNSLLLTDFKLQNLKVLFKSEKMFDLPLVTEKFIAIREGVNNEEIHLIELGAEIKISSISSTVFKGVPFSFYNNEQLVNLNNELTHSAMAPAVFEHYLKKDLSNTIVLIPSEYELLAMPSSSFASDKAEAYPRLDHLIPHYWFFAVGTSENLNSIGALTSFIDPMEVHILNATALVYPSERKLGGTLEYTQKLVKVSDLWSVSSFFNQDYSKTNFDSMINLSRDLEISTKYKWLLKKWTYTPGMSAGTSTTNDFISNRSINKLDIAQSLSYQALTYDDFIQYFSTGLNLGVDKSTLGSAYLTTEVKSGVVFRLNQDLLSSLKSSYSKLFKSDFKRGVAYGGGVSDFTKSRTHEFHGLPYSDAFGNQVFSTRMEFDYNFWDIYRGKNLIPIFFKEAHLLLGHDSLYADRIFLDNSILRRKMINSFYIGPRIKMNLFYSVPTNIDFIFSSISSPHRSRINVTELNISADLF